MTPFEKITDGIVKGLEKEGLEWFKPWVSVNSPINHFTEKSYRGLNVLFLNVGLGDQEFTYNEWATYTQFKKGGYQVKKGSKGTAIVFYKISYKDPDGKWHKDEKAVKAAGFELKDCSKRWTPLVHTLFNIAQAEDENGNNPEPKTEIVDNFEPIKSADMVFDNYPESKRPTLNHGGDSAFYRPSEHMVQMPQKAAFKTPDDYYKTLFHELVHSTGAKNINNRKGIVEFDGFGSEQYSQEELVAEIGALFLTTITGVEATSDSQAYINHWSKKLKDAPSMAYFAAKEAIAAVEFIRDGKY